MQTRSSRSNTDLQRGSESKDNPEFPELHYVSCLSLGFFQNKSVLLKDGVVWPKQQLLTQKSDI